MAIRREEQRRDSIPQRPDAKEPQTETARTGTQALSGPPEPWEAWETRLVAWSLAIGFAGLIVLGWLVDRFILS